MNRSAARVLVLTSALAALALPASALAIAKPENRARPFLDARAHARASQAATPATTQAAARLQARLGTQGVVSLDRVTGTPRVVAKLNGYLTGPSHDAPARIALGYVRAHPTLFGDPRGLSLTQNTKDIAGITHLIWQQRIHGIPVFGNDLRASVATDGRLINVLGAPLRTAGTRPQAPKITAAQAHARAMENAGSGVPVRATSKARLVYLALPGGPQLAWQVRARKSSTEDYAYLVGARDGRILYRDSLVDFASGKVWEYYPSDLLTCGTSGNACDQLLKTFPWATASTKLQSNNTHTFLDVLDDDTPVAGDEVGPSSGTSWSYTFMDYTDSAFLSPCTSDYKCSWDSFTSDSWRYNMKQDATQVYYYVNKFHDHLLAAPIGFTEAAGNFQQVNSTGKGKGGDPVLANVDDGADTGGGFPDNNHVNNANMATPSDGTSPRMQMYLFTSPFVDGNGGDDASVIYHEYTHGLSNRLVHYADGSSALDAAQGGAMGEAWSDWYAMDYLVKQGYDHDTATVGDILVGFFISAGEALIRTEPIDCPVGASSANCPGTPGAGSGGYTYGDYGDIIGFPEVHADGEIWGQTLWDLRQKLGYSKSEALITRAMMLSPPAPSFLDMRNAIIQADTVLYSKVDLANIWSVFAKRGMGYFASTTGADDTHPVENFALPPASGSPTGTVVGKVTDVTTGVPIPDASVAFGGHNSGFAGTNLAGTAGWTGAYSILKVPTGTYPHLFGVAKGWDKQTQTNVTVATGTNTRNFTLRRDWAAKAGGAVVTSFNGPDYTQYGCGPSAAIDQSLGSGWGSDVAGGAKFMIVKLPLAVNLSTFAVDPGATCGDADSASVKGYKIETSPNGTTWTQAAAGNFNNSNNHHLNTITPSAGKTNVRYVRFTMLSTQGANQFMDMTELEVYGLPTVVPKITGFTPTSGRTGSSVTISGAGFTGANAVWFNGKKATTFTAGASSITATVPNGATTGKIAVRTLGGTVYSASNYTVTLSITGFTPTSGPAGTSVTITGVGFTGVTSVKFNGTSASFTVVSPTQIKAVVPSSATSGKISVTTAAGTVFSAASFTKT